MTVIARENGLDQHDRRSGVRRPTGEECEKLGWFVVRACTRSERMNQYDQMRQWCADRVFWADYRWDHFRVYFKNESDHLMFLLKWS